MYLLIGAGGFLGSYLIRSILHKTGENVTAVSRTGKGNSFQGRVSWVSCDITSREQVDALADKLCQESLKIIFLAAYHHPDLVDCNPRTAWDTNVTALSYFLNRFDNVKRLFYPSTDSVYGESANHYHFTEKDPICPVNRYGVHKILAEQLVTGYGYNVVRYPFLIGPSCSERKHFYDEIADSLKAGKPVEMFFDSYRSSLDFVSAANFLIKLMQMDGPVPQIVNICGDDDLSKYDVGLMIARKLGVSAELVIPISISKNTGIFQAKRAHSTLMDNTLFKRLSEIKEIHLSLESEDGV